MSTEQPEGTPAPQSDATPDAAAGRQHWTSDEILAAKVRRVPKYSVFMAFGVVVGIFVALILTFSWNGSAGPSPLTGVQYSSGQVFGFLAIFCGVIGLGIGGIVALIIDKISGRRTRTVLADRETVVDD